MIGISPGDSPEHANEFCTHVVATGIGQARNLAVVASARSRSRSAAAWGTLSRRSASPGASAAPSSPSDSWRPVGEGEMAGAPGIVFAETAAEAVALALE